MESKICTQCNIEKHINKFYKKYSECKDCNIKRGVKRYYDNKYKLSNQHKIYYEKNRDILLAKFKIYQQNRKSHTQQIKDLNYKIEELTQAMETLISKIEQIYKNL